MKIACVIHSLNGGGAERVMAALCSRLCERDHDVLLVTLDDGTQDRHQVSQDVRRACLDLMTGNVSLLTRLFKRRRRLVAIRESIVQFGPDVVLSFCDRTNIDVLLALKGTGIPVVVSERSDPGQQSLGWFWEYRRRRAYRSAHVIALTQTSADYLQPMVDRGIHVIPSAVDVPGIDSDRDAAQAKQMFVAVGRLEHEKGFDRLLEAFASVLKTDATWRLKIFGEGTQRSTLIRQASALGITKQIELPGWVRPIWPELAQSTIFVLPSRYEGFPSALLEAMAVGLPCVSVDCESGPRAIVDQRNNALLVENTVAGLAEGMRELILDEKLREQLASNAKEIVQLFSWDKMVDAYEDVLARAVGES